MELLYVVKKFWGQLPDDGEIIEPKHVGSMQNIVSINCKILYLFVLQELFTSLRKLNRFRIHKAVLSVMSIYFKNFKVFPSLSFPFLLADSVLVWGDSCLSKMR